MLKVWGRDNSVNVQKVLWACDEIGLAFQRIDAGGNFGVVDTPQYRALNPNGLVPTLDDDGFVLWESNAIVRYLAARHSAGKLWPQEPRTRAEADRWMDWMISTFWPSFRPLFWNLVRTPADRRDAHAIEQSLARSAEILGWLDEHLQTRPYIAGDQFTMGDIPMGCAIWRWLALPIARPGYPALQRWFDRLAERPAYRAVVMQPLT